jgi:hypothetical protein
VADSSIFSRTSKSTQPYQRERVSITGLRLNLEKGMKTGRLIGVACLDLFAFLFGFVCRPPDSSEKCQPAPANRDHDQCHRKLTNNCNTVE